MWRIKTHYGEWDLCGNLAALLVQQGGLRFTPHGKREEYVSAARDIVSIEPVRTLHNRCDVHPNYCP